MAVEARRDEELLHFRSFAEDEIGVRREGDRGIDHFFEVTRLERGHAVLAGFDRIGDIVPVFRQRLAAEIVGNRVHQARLALLRKRAER